jgi:hypothetical protein
MTSGGFTTTGMQVMLCQFTLDEVRVVSTVAALASATTATSAADIGAVARPVAVFAGGRRRQELPDVPARQT